jgi:LPXTG-site transpeptidase (sortase) family protein
MYSKISARRSLFILGIVGIIFSLIIILFVVINYELRKIVINNLVESAQNIIPAQQASSGIPIRLKIPTINVDAKIDPVGVTSKGEVGVPKGPTHTSWFDLGPRPGEDGSAVITGHYGTWENGEGSVFDNLNKLVKGDKIYVEDDKGITTTFIVRESMIYNPTANASSVFYFRDGKAHLNLITCEGVWEEAQKTYSNRLVVFADKE